MWGLEGYFQIGEGVCGIILVRVLFVERYDASGLEFHSSSRHDLSQTGSSYTEC